ncbi:hypothetical protein AZI86_02455 [Bdellovibrio bacteriovorus]|uniref:Uncharacterized protein n=1 Tax=Bdellovibrio bacteriovorus TaxID=959 RepID=A0A150WN83_BDEBC|nr:hypothetical protein AZI86_02455 [Bdellovibrio bacteriovorus]
MKRKLLLQSSPTFQKSIAEEFRKQSKHSTRAFFSAAANFFALQLNPLLSVSHDKTGFLFSNEINQLALA